MSTDQVLWKNCGKRRNCSKRAKRFIFLNSLPHNPEFWQPWEKSLQISTMFSIYSITNLEFLVTFVLYAWKCFQFQPVWNFPYWLKTKQTLFLFVYRSSPLKTLWEKEKLLKTSNFSFSNSVFYPFERTFCHFHWIQFAICKLFQFGRV